MSDEHEHEPDEQLNEDWPNHPPLDEEALVPISVDDLGERLAVTTASLDGLNFINRQLTESYEELARILYRAQREESAAKAVLKEARAEALKIVSEAIPLFQKLQPRKDLLIRILAKANAGQPPVAADAYKIEQWIEVMKQHGEAEVD